MTRRSRAGSPSRRARRSPSGSPSPPSACRRCATARTRISRPPSTPTAASGRASPRRASCRARSFPTTTSATPRRPTNAWPSSRSRRSSWSSTPTPAAWPSAADQYSAYLKAYACDPVSIFGGIVAVNTTLEARTAEDLSKLFLEVVIAPDATPEALAIFAKRKNVRVLLAGTLPDPLSPGMTMQQRGRRLPAAEPRQRPSSAGATSRSSPSARRRRRSSTTCCSPSRSAST